MLGTSILIHKKRPGPAVKLSLVALMDIFTILVFFLLLNSGDSQTLEDAKFVKLPDSSSETSPHSELVIHVGTEELWMDNEKVIDIADIELGPKQVITPLAEALQNFLALHGDLSEHEQTNGLAITLMADRAVPYEILKSVMATCSGENFRDISLAVNRVAAPVFDASGSPASDTPVDDGGSAADPASPSLSSEEGL